MYLALFIAGYASDGARARSNSGIGSLWISAYGRNLFCYPKLRLLSLKLNIDPEYKFTCVLGKEAFGYGRRGPEFLYCMPLVSLLCLASPFSLLYPLSLPSPFSVLHSPFSVL